MINTQEGFKKLAHEGKNIFLTGKAGTGKSYVLKEYINEIGIENVILTSSTGISALSIGGVTLHSVFSIFGLQYQKDPGYSNINWYNIQTVIIDEISMVGPDMLDQIDKFLRFYRDPDKLFGGVQMILVGDKAQLQPVYVPYTDRDAEIIKLFGEHYGELTFDKADSFKGFETVELEKVYRQDEGEFLDILNEIRSGNIDAIHRVNSDIPREAWNNSVHIMPYNKMVNAHNKRALAALNTPAKVYKGLIKDNFNTKYCITPEELELKIGALVMVTSNLDNGLKNGSLGQVTGFKKGAVEIEVDDKKYMIGINEWKQQGYTKKGLTTLGSFYQIPLKLAWASTIHKTQGLTLDRVIFHYHKGLDKNQVYVGLSRAKTLDNLYVKK